MKFINTTKNTVQIDDIGLSVEYQNDTPQEIDTELVKKSLAFQKMVSMGCFRVVEVSDERIEKNLFKVSQRAVFQEPIVPERGKSGSKTETIIRGHFYDASGYAKVNRNLALTLYRKGVCVEIDPVTIRGNCLNEIEAKIMSVFRRPVGKDAIQIDSVIPTQAKPLDGNYNILYTTAESSGVPNQFVKAANQYNELWVTSSFSARSFIDSGYNGKVTVVHPVVNPNLYNPQVQSCEFRPGLRSFSFLSVQTWGYRKGSEVLLRAFCDAFTNKDDVSLVLLISESSRTQQSKIKEEVGKILSEYPCKPHILISHKGIPEYQMPSFYKSFNAFVLPSRGEGFGLPYCEAALCGLPVIATKYGGSLDFLDENNSYLVDVDGFEIAEKGKTGIHYWDGQRFPKLGGEFISGLSDSLRLVASDKNLNSRKAALLRSKVIDMFSGEKTGKQTKEIVDKIWEAR